MKPTAEWGPKLQHHRVETHAPKHTDSQVPLTLPNYDPDAEDNDFENSKNFGSVYYNSSDGLHMSTKETGF